MASGGAVTSYELHILQGGRWEFHARFARDEKNQAITEAKNLDKLSHISAVRVVKDSFDSETGTSNEVTVYKSSKGKADVSASKGRGAVLSGAASGGRGSRGVVVQGARGGPRSAAADRMIARLSEGEENENSPRKRWGLFTKLAVIIGLSILVAALLAGVTTLAVTRMPQFARALGPEDQGVAILGAFVIGFLLTGAILAFSLISHEDLASQPGQPSKTAVAEPPPPPIDKGLTLDDEALEDSLDSAAKSLEEFKEKLAETPIPELTPLPEPAATTEEPAASEAPKSEALNPFVEAQKMTAMTFLGHTVAAIKAKALKLDNYNRFGLTLFLAGACEALGTDRALNKITVSHILTEIVSTLGTARDQAAAFAERYDSYLLSDARYLTMFQAGRQAMNDHLSDTPDAAAKVTEALAEWSAPKPKEVAVKGTLTVMFTDMVGSTSLTQTMGDAGAQQVVRTHNRIVRNALASFNGKEIKHTGDGIMASFAATTNGVEACIAIQRQIKSHNAVSPETPLHVRIGINAGEPIREENDLFGSVVQMAARVCAKADTDQIFVSEVVKALCSGKDIAIESRGGFELKGFAQPVELHEVIWDRPAPASAVAAGLDAVAAAPRPAAPPLPPAAKSATPAPAAPKPVPTAPKPAPTGGFVAGPAGGAPTPRVVPPAAAAAPRSAAVPPRPNTGVKA